MELRHWTLSDAMELTSLCNAVDRHHLSDRLPNPYTEKDAEEWLKMVTDNDTITGIYRAIVCDRKLIGYMHLNEYKNKGIATEAVKQVCTIAFKVLSFEQITANVFQPNIASIRVLLKNGFKYKGTIPNAVIKDGNVSDLLIYVFMWFYNEFLANRHGVNSRQSLTLIVSSFHDVASFK